MSTWNIRIMHKLHSNGEHEFFPCEVYYSDDEAKEVRGWTELRFTADSMQDLGFYVKEVKKALSRTVLEYSTGKEYKPTNQQTT